MEKIITYYNKIKTDNLQKVASLAAKIHLAGTIRLLLILLLFISIWIFKGSTWQILTCITLIIIVAFVSLMILHNKLSYKKDYAATLAQLCEDEIKGINGDYSAFNGETDVSYSNHAYAEDLDIFGQHSLFQCINRTITPQGNKLLAQWLLSPLTDKEEILNRQEAITELSNLPAFRQKFFTIGKLNTQYPKIDIKNTTGSTRYLTFWKIISWLIPAIWFVLIMLNAFVPSSVYVIYFIFCIVIANYNAKDIMQLHTNMGKTENGLKTYARLIKLIEDQSFSSKILSSLQQNLSRNKAAENITYLSRLIGALDQRFSLMGILLNIFLLRDFRIGLKINHWIDKNAEQIENWLTSLIQIDAFNSLATFAFNHPNYNFPEITNTYFTMYGENIGHPLMKPNTCVTNNINIQHSPNFMVITGANMAGKSTYLRTVGINYVLGCLGAPVYADKMLLYPTHLITSLRTTDSLNKNESYFFAELKRLKTIIDDLKSGKKLFIILDEILKGTNSQDKQKGSLALIKQLIGYKSVGIIATHDLILGELIKTFPQEIKNYRFEADINNNQLSFSYKMQEGVAQNMNACFLMKEMGIIM